MIKWLKNLFTPHPMSEFVIRMRKDPWLYKVYSRVIDLSDPQLQQGNPVLAPMFQSDEGREKLLLPIFEELLEIAGADDRLIAFRRWLHEIAVSFAQLHVLCADPDFYLNLLPEHPGVVGISDRIEEVIQAQTDGWLYDEYRRIGDVNATVDSLLADFALWYFHFQVVVLAQDALGDIVKGEEGLWTKYYLASNCAFIEESHRHLLGLPSLCEPGSVMLEHLTLQENVLKGYKNPLEGVTLARANDAGA